MKAYLHKLHSYSIKGLVSLLLIFQIGVAFSQQAPVKLITPGEHLGFTLEYFTSDKKPAIYSFQSGSVWTAVYVKENVFFTKKEVLICDTSHNVVIRSEGTQTPVFYVQGIDKINSGGKCTVFKETEIQTDNVLPLRTWKLGKDTYFLGSIEDTVASRINASVYGTLPADKPVKIYKTVNLQEVQRVHVNPEQLVHLRWTGDLNGDTEPDFLVAMPSHHETIVLELFLSQHTAKGTIWIRNARFTEWS